MAIQSKITNEIGFIALDRPEKANAYDKAHLANLQSTFRELANEVSVIVLHSAHARFFCAGADLDEMKDATPEDARNLMSQAVFTEIARSTVITIAAIDGPAVAGGFELALSADLRVIGRDASFRLPEVSMGIIPAAGGTTRLSSILGASIAKHVILGGTTITADSAIRWGLGVDGKGDALKTATEWAQRIRDNPNAARAAKRIVNNAAEDASLRDERETQATLYSERSD